jgi:hypothetical protein
MAQPSGPDAELAFTLFLQACVERGVVPLDVAERLDRFRRTAGPELLRAFLEIGLPAPAGMTAGGGDAGKAAGYEPQLLDGTPHPALTFESFVPSRGNAFAVEVARAMAAPNGTPSRYNPLYVCAGVGMGKSHLLSAIGNAVGGRRVLLLNAAELAVELERARRMQAEAELWRYVMAADLLLLDDVQLCQGQDGLQRGLFTCLDNLERRRRAAVVTGLLPPAELTGLEPRLRSRLQSGVTVQLQMAARSEREEIVRRTLAPDVLPDEIVAHLAERNADSVRALIAGARQLLAQQEVSGRPLTLADVRGDGAAAAEPDEPDEPPAPASPAAAEPSPAADPTPWAARFKGMLTAAETEDEQAMALQMAVAERLRQLRKEGAEPELVRRFTEALDLLSAGRRTDAVQRIFM